MPKPIAARKHSNTHRIIVRLQPVKIVPGTGACTSPTHPWTMRAMRVTQIRGELLQESSKRPFPLYSYSGAAEYPQNLQAAIKFNGLSISMPQERG